ncbi:type II secretion system F family protein, partial [Chloroflexota bacterium]
MNYAYLGYTEDRQIVKGRVSATDARAAAEMLDNFGYRVVSLKPVSTFMPAKGGFLTAKVKTSEMVTFSRQLALLLQSGVGIIQALELLSSQATDKALRIVLSEVINDLRRGKGLSTALAQHPRVFSTLYCKMISVGEQTGSLETVLRNLADYTERQAAATAKIKQAMMYPIVVFFLAIVVAAIMLVVLLPPLVDMFTKLGGTLPLPTRILLSSMGFLVALGILAAVSVTFLSS